jgi:hypothetical protein
MPWLKSSVAKKAEHSRDSNPETPENNRALTNGYFRHHEISPKSLGAFGCETYRRAGERTDKRDFRIMVHSRHFMQTPKYPSGARSVSKVFDIKQETEITHREPRFVRTKFQIQR